MRTVDRRGRTGGSDPRKSKEDEEVDRISDLPDSLLLHILSFLPFRCAVRASLMLRPFRGLWRSLSMLSFEECDFHACRGRSGAGGGEFLNFVNHALALHESPEIHTFRIELDFHASGSTNPEFDGRGVMSNRLDEWIFFTLKKKVKVLDVALDGCGRLLRALPALHYRVPSAVLGSSSLVNLTLKVCNIESLGQIHLKSLQKLSMFDVNLSEEVIQNLVSGSPSLKKVSLSHCHGLQVLKFDRHPSLEELNVCLCVDLEKVDLASSGIKILSVYIVYPLSKIICPNVMTLELDGSINEVNLDWGSSLNDVALYFYHFGGFFEEHEEVKTLVEKFCNIAYVTLGNWIILISIPPMVLCFPSAALQHMGANVSTMPNFQLEGGSITTWNDMAQKFLSKYFPPAKSAKMRNDITSFVQMDGESLYEAWERFKELLRRCPHHGLPVWMQVHTFYNGVMPNLRSTIDAAAGGTLNNKSPEEAFDLLEEMAANSYQ
ncbi:F-box/LRR-repeat protein At3g03360-like [Syzygium oleosum]|uniref:F-box/LRR-repeat protein At3g03360-like n=1 Tax=Syzygium oleosum TaxID=219896 RepID=UPI0024BADBBD|nr:F-box/LRR-repeat protein At3g03360-like [Syzygium oleosum]